jgi:hypothetical protein
MQQIKTLMVGKQTVCMAEQSQLTAEMPKRKEGR